MRRFAVLYDALDRTRSTNAKVTALSSWLAGTPAEDAAWAVALLLGRRPKRVIKTNTLVAWVRGRAAIPEWLFAECYAAVGDLAEAITLLAHAGASHAGPLAPGVPGNAGDPGDIGNRPQEPAALHIWMEERIPALGALDDADKPAWLDAWLTPLPERERFLLLKIITGEFRVGVSQTLVARALADLAGVDQSTIAARLMGEWAPSAGFFAALIAGKREGAGEDQDRDPSQPYPFFLAHPLEAEPEELGPASEWQVEWKWDGIRGQLIRRRGKTWLWSRGEEIISERFPEILEVAERLPEGTVLDGEVLGYKDGAPLPFGALQTRIGRKTVGKKSLAECPAVFMAYDLLEQEGRDIRALPLGERRALLEALAAATPGLLVSPLVTAGDWDALKVLRDQSRTRYVEGFMLKRRTSPYRAGRPKGDWWKWKIDPLTVDAVMTYAQKGHGRRASRYTDYTFAVWSDDGELVTIATAYSGLTNEEIDTLDAWIRRNTLQRFGPVAAVRPEHVFELHFDDIRRSTRHKSGVALRFPRIGRWRMDKLPKDANTLAGLKTMIGHEPTE